MIIGTEQAQQASDDGNEHEVISNHTLNFASVFTHLGDSQGHKNASSSKSSTVPTTGSAEKRGLPTVATTGGPTMKC